MIYINKIFYKNYEMKNYITSFVNAKVYIVPDETSLWRKTDTLWNIKCRAILRSGFLRENYTIPVDNRLDKYPQEERAVYGLSQNYVEDDEFLKLFCSQCISVRLEYCVGKEHKFTIDVIKTDFGTEKGIKTHTSDERLEFSDDLVYDSETGYISIRPATNFMNIKNN